MLRVCGNRVVGKAWAVRYRWVRFFNVVEGHEDEYLSWYNDKHLRDIVAVEGWNAGQLFRAAQRPDPPEAQLPEYLSMVDIEVADLSTALDAMGEARKSWVAPGFQEDVMRDIYEPISDRFEKLSNVRTEWRGR
jgi:hypothetical protein